MKTGGGGAQQGHHEVDHQADQDAADHQRAQRKWERLQLVREDGEKRPDDKKRDEPGSERRQQPDEPGRAGRRSVGQLAQQATNGSHALP